MRKDWLLGEFQACFQALPSLPFNTHPYLRLCKVFALLLKPNHFTCPAVGPDVKLQKEQLWNTAIKHSSPKLLNKCSPKEASAGPLMFPSVYCCYDTIARFALLGLQPALPYQAGTRPPIRVNAKLRALCPGRCSPQIQACLRWYLG